MHLYANDMPFLQLYLLSDIGMRRQERTTEAPEQMGTEEVRYPMRKRRGLCLASTATLVSLAERQLWLHRPTHRGLPTRGPSLPSMPNKERCHSTESVLPRHGVLACDPATRDREGTAGEPSLSVEPECLNLHRSILAQEAKSGEGKPLYSGSPPQDWGPGTPAANRLKIVRVIVKCSGRKPADQKRVTLHCGGFCFRQMVLVDLSYADL